MCNLSGVEAWKIVALWADHILSLNNGIKEQV